MKMRIAIVCEDALLREGLCCLLSGLPSCESVSSSSSFRDLKPRIEKGEFDVVVAFGDLEKKVVLSLERAREARPLRVVAVSEPGSSPNDVVDRAVSRSAGFEAIRSALEGSVAPAGRMVKERRIVYGLPKGLTPREREVAHLVSQGLPNRRIASTLGIREQSVKNLVSMVMRKLDCENRVQLALHLSSPNH